MSQHQYYGYAHIWTIRLNSVQYFSSAHFASAVAISNSLKKAIAADLAATDTRQSARVSSGGKDLPKTHFGARKQRSTMHTLTFLCKATEMALALRRLKGLPPKTVRHLAISAVLPVVDYVSPIWYPLATQEMMQLLQQAQRITA
jgi:hypothetical protein